MFKRTVGFGVGHLMGWLWVVLALLFSGNSLAADTVCAQVKIEIKQELTLERQAFDAMMRINNGLDTLPINNVKVTVNFQDEDGLPVLASSDPNSTDAKFFIRVDTMDNIADVDGYGSVAPATTAEIHWLIIPSTGAAEDSPTGKLYFVGAKLDYTLGGEPESVVVTPDFITVKPLPKLTLDYFLTKEVNADDPLTPEIEPIEPYTLGVRVRNNGLAAAKELKIDSAQPKIIENEQGLLIGFEITGSSVNDEPIAPVLLIDFGDIAGNSSKVGRWEMISTLAGEFVDFTATFTHADELGGALTSILEATNAHLLVRDVLVDLPGRDGVRDFLAIDTGVLRVYESDSVDTEVTDQSSQASFTLDSQSGTQVDHTLSFPVTAGFSYVKLLDPYNGQKIITQVVRSDGKVISLNNAWTSKTRDKSTHPYSWTHYLNFFDTNTTGTYAVRMDAEVLGPVPPVLQYIPPRTTYEGNQVGFVVEASDPNGEIPALSAAPLPNGAAFVDNGDGTAFFNWTPTVGQAGTYTITYTATDGALSASRSATIKVNPEWDTDGDGMADAWEIEHFGNLDRDGTGDFDGDGISDLDEYLDGTDPSDGPQPPTINSPLYDAEVTSLQPTLSVLNSAHAPGVTMTYDYEVYADAAMTQLVASADNVAEGQDNTGWMVPVSLDDNTGYTWRVRAFDGNVYSLWTNGRFFVNTVNDAPGAFTISSPADGAELDLFSPLLVVTNALDPDRDAISYRFEVSEYIDISTTVASVESIPEGTSGTTSWLVDVPLAENGYYYWRATAVDEHGLETHGPIGGFFINATNEAPLAPVVNTPLDGSVISGSSVSLIVDNGSDPDGDLLTYTFELDTAPTFDSVAKQVSSAIAEGTTTTEWAVTGLMENTTYYWRTKVSDGQIESNWVEASFSVNAANSAPGIPTVANPGDGAWVATLQPTLSVNAAVDPDGDTLEYRFELYSDEAMTGLVADTVSASTAWDLATPLLNNEWYYWRVRAEDPHGGLSDWSPASRFFVDDNGVNDTPTLSFIEPSADIIVSTGVTTLVWSDDDPDSSATIALYYDSNNTGADGTLIANAIEEDVDETGDTYDWSVTTIPPGTYWVYAVIDDGNSSTTVYGDFSITVEPTEILFDNTDTTATAHGVWTASTGVSGYLGDNYQFHVANGPSPDAVMIDNSDPAFTTLGDWTASTSISGYLGDNYQYHAADGEPVDGLVIDNLDPAFHTAGTWPSSTAVAGYEGADYQVHESNGIPPAGIVIDNTDANVTSVGSWSGSTGVTGYYQSNYEYHAAGVGNNAFTWTATIVDSGRYQVYARWTSHANRATNAPYFIQHDGGETPFAVNQQLNGGQWNLLGSFDYTQGGQYNITLTDAADGYVIADAIKLVPEGADPNSAIWDVQVPSDGQYQVYARWTSHENRASNATYTVQDGTSATWDQVSVDQRTNGGSWNLLGTYTFYQSVVGSVTLTDRADGYVIADAIKLVPVYAQPNTASWQFDVPQSDQYRVFARWTAHPNRATDATYTVHSDMGGDPVSVNQQLDGGVWNLLGTYSFTAGQSYHIDLTDQADGYVIADAIMVSPVSAEPNRFIWNLTIPQAGQYELYARWTAHPNRATDATYTVLHDGGETPVSVNQQTNGAKWNLLGTFSFTQSAAYQVTLTDQADGYVIADGIRLVPIE
ncbi:MAG: Ig-like domain-containing protein [Candidatus Thiodiazotropha sp.]